jgi:hypothetical protein
MTDIWGNPYRDIHGNPATRHTYVFLQSRNTASYAPVSPYRRYRHPRPQSGTEERTLARILIVLLAGSTIATLHLFNLLPSSMPRGTAYNVAAYVTLALSLWFWLDWERVWELVTSLPYVGHRIECTASALVRLITRGLFICLIAILVGIPCLDFYYLFIR